MFDPTKFKDIISSCFCLSASYSIHFKGDTKMFAHIKIKCGLDCM